MEKKINDDNLTKSMIKMFDIYDDIYLTQINKGNCHLTMLFLHYPDIYVTLSDMGGLLICTASLTR